jgi:hypothetical protein
VGNIKTDLGEIGWDGIDWIDLAQDRDWLVRALVNIERNLRVPWNAGKFLSSCTTGGLSRRAQFHDVSCKTAGKISLYGILRALRDSGMEGINHLLNLIRSGLARKRYFSALTVNQNYWNSATFPNDLLAVIHYITTFPCIL